MKDSKYWKTISYTFPRWLEGEEPVTHRYYPLINTRALDHFEQRQLITGEIICISQPYELSYNVIKEMVEVCEKHRIRFNITGDSDHYPGRTILIEWKKIEDMDKEKA